MSGRTCNPRWPGGHSWSPFIGDRRLGLECNVCCNPGCATSNLVVGWNAALAMLPGNEQWDWEAWGASEYMGDLQAVAS